jgi:hypothetical protein
MLPEESDTAMTLPSSSEWMKYAEPFALIWAMRPSGVQM